jgi:hypothetical protein
MTNQTEDDETGKDPVADALGSIDAARHVALVTGMSKEAATTYAAFHSGRWAQGPAGGRAAA